MNIQADEPEPPRAAVPKSMAAYTRYPQATTHSVMPTQMTSAAGEDLPDAGAARRDPARFPVTGDIVPGRASSRRSNGPFGLPQDHPRERDTPGRKSAQWH